MYFGGLRGVAGPGETGMFPNEELWPQAEVSDDGTMNGRGYCRSTVKRLTEYPSAPPMKISDKK